MEWGVAALGRSGEVIVEVLEALPPDEGWEILVELPGLQLTFAVPGEGAVDEIAAFLVAHRGRGGRRDLALEVGVLRLTKDDEDPARFFASLWEGQRTRVFVDLDEPLVGELIAALEDLQRSRR